MGKMKTKIAAAVLAALLCVPTLALARAGGGHGGSHSSGSSGHSSFSSSSSFSSPSSAYSSVSKSVPCEVKFAGNPAGIAACQKQNNRVFLVVLAIAAIVVLGYLAQNRARKNAPLGDFSDMGGESPDVQPSSSLADGIAKLKELDPLWNEQKFKELVNTGFFKIQNAWCVGDMTGARAFVSDGIMRRFTIQLEPYVAKKQRNVLGQLSLDSVELLDVTSDEKYSYVSTLVTATCTDTVVDAEGKIVESNYGGELTTWSEIWIWMRSNAAVTQEDEKGVFADKCPNCGATLKITAVGKCDYCGSELTKGDFDWVLSEIGQVDA